MGYELFPFQGENAFSGDLQPMDKHLGDTLHEIKAEFMVRLAGYQEMGSVEDHSPHRLLGPRLEMPHERGEKPGPAQHVSFPDGLNLPDLTPPIPEFQDHLAAEDQEKNGPPPPPG